MRDREHRWAGYAGGLLGFILARGIAQRFPVASLVVTVAAALWFVAWLVRDSLRFRREVAEHRRQLAERRAIARAAKERARRAW